MEGKHRLTGEAHPVGQFIQTAVTGNSINSRNREFKDKSTFTKLDNDFVPVNYRSVRTRLLPLELIIYIKWRELRDSLVMMFVVIYK